MRTRGPTAQTILDLLDPREGGVFSADYDYLQRGLAERGCLPEKSALYNILARLVGDGKVERVPTDDGGSMYTRPDVLLGAPGLATVIPDTPALKVRRTRDMTDERYENAKRRAINARTDAAVQAGAHDFRLNAVTGEWHTCRTCGRDENGRFGPCKLRVAAEEGARQALRAADARKSGSASASRAKSESHAGKRGT